MHTKHGVRIIEIFHDTTAIYARKNLMGIQYSLLTTGFQQWWNIMSV